MFFRIFIKNILLLTAIMHIVISIPVEADVVADRESKIKSVFIFNFTRYISWPGGNSSKKRICIYGETPLSSILRYIHLSKFKDTTELTELNTKNEVKSCNIVFISNGAVEDIKSLTNEFKKNPILFVSDLNNFANLGGGIEFYKRDERIFLKMNYESIQKSGLKVSSKLLEIVDIKKRD